MFGGVASVAGCCSRPLRALPGRTRRRAPNAEAGARGRDCSCGRADSLPERSGTCCRVPSWRCAGVSGWGALDRSRRRSAARGAEPDEPLPRRRGRSPAGGSSDDEGSCGPGSLLATRCCADVAAAPGRLDVARVAAGAPILLALTSSSSFRAMDPDSGTVDQDSVSQRKRLAQPRQTKRRVAARTHCVAFPAVRNRTYPAARPASKPRVERMAVSRGRVFAKLRRRCHFLDASSACPEITFRPFRLKPSR